MNGAVSTMKSWAFEIPAVTVQCPGQDHDALSTSVWLRVGELRMHRELAIISCSFWLIRTLLPTYSGVLLLLLYLTRHACHGATVVLAGMPLTAPSHFNWHCRTRWSAR